MTWPKQQIAKHISKRVRSHGFKKKGDGWYRISNENVLSVINIQKSSYDNAVYINIGLTLPSLHEITEPMEHKFHIRGRLATVLPNCKEPIHISVSDSTQQLRDIELLASTIEDVVVPLLDSLNSEVALKRFIASESARGFAISQIIRQRLS